MEGDGPGTATGASDPSLDRAANWRDDDQGTNGGEPTAANKVAGLDATERAETNPRRRDRGAEGELV
jgi:hypothetical protein